MPLDRILNSEKLRLETLEALQILDTKAEREFDAIAKMASLACDTPIALISLVAEDRQWFKAQWGLPGGSQTSREVSFCAHAILQEDVFEIPDAAADPRFADNPLVTGEPHIRFYAGAPLVTTNGARIGTVCVIDTKAKKLDSRQRQMLTQLAEMAAVTMESRQRSAKNSMNDAKFRKLSDSAPLGIFATDAAGSCLYTNSSWQQIYGLAAEESLGDGWIRSIHPDDRDDVFARWKDTADRDVPFDHEFRVSRHGHDVRFVRAVANSVRTAEGTISGFVGSVEDVTEKHLSKAALDEERMRLASIIIGTHAGTWEWNVATGEVRFNELWASMLGYELSDLKPMNLERWGALVHPADLVVSEALLRRHFAREISFYECEVRMRHRDGHWVWMHTRGQVLTRTKQGGAEWMYGTHIDITSRKDSEVALRKSEELLGQIGEVAGVGVWEYDVESEVITWSDQTCRIQGVPKGYVPQIEEAMSFYTPDSQKLIKAAVETAIATESGWDLELEITTASGEFRWVRATGVAERKPSGGIRLYGSFQDINERILQQNALAKAHERVSIATESAEIGVWEYDLTSQRLVWNEQMHSLYDVPMGAPLTYNTYLDAVHPDSRSAANDAINDAIAGRREFDIEFPIVQPNGSIRYLKANARVVRNAEGSPIRMIGVNWDISERVAQANELHAARQRAEEALDVKGRFLAMMSHELRTPLNAVVGFSNLLMESNEAKTPSGERYLRNIEAASKTLLGIVNDVMIVSKSQAGAIELDPQPFRIADTIEDTAAMLRHQAQVKGLKFKLVYDPTIPDFVLGDDARLKQVLLNLLSNAVKFTREGEVSLYVILLRTEEQNADIRFVIRDTGIGIPQESQHKLFKRFSQVDQTISRQFGGSGLGLSICKDLLELMGSTIDVESQEGEGTKFTFDLSLPVVETMPTRASELSETGEAPKTLKILVAEDVEMNQELLETILAQRGHKVTIVGNGIEAVEAVTRERYDLVLMDVHMPLMDGLEATRRIRAHVPQGQSLPIIALTANVLSSEVERFLAVGMNAHVGKPFAPKELFAAIQKWGMPSGEGKVDESKDRAPSVAPIFDEATLAEMRELMGPLKTHSLLNKLKVQTFQSFHETSDRARLCQQAHSLASSSGMLGFQRLSKACLALENAIQASAAMEIEFETALVGAISARDESLDTMQHQLANAA